MAWNNLRSFLLRQGLYAARYQRPAAIGQALSALRPNIDQRLLIRIGGDSDGGYLVPDRLDAIAACFSPGVDVTATFETDLAGRGIPSHLCDASVDGPPPGLTPASFEKRFVGPYEDGAYTTLEDWFCRHAALDDGRDYILQMDIEGDEYDVIIATPRPLLRKFRILVIEFHNLERLFDPDAAHRLARAFTKLSHDFQSVHLHPNNGWGELSDGKITLPKFLEVTYLRRDYCAPTTAPIRLPHPLDRQCVPGRDELVLDPAFYR